MIEMPGKVKFIQVTKGTGIDHDKRYLLIEIQTDSSLDNMVIPKNLGAQLDLEENGRLMSIHL